jgi:hypothetical protein
MPICVKWASVISLFQNGCGHFGEAFYGRQVAYLAALRSPDGRALEKTLARNIFNGVNDDGPRRLARYARVLMRELPKAGGMAWIGTTPNRLSEAVLIWARSRLNFLFWDSILIRAIRGQRLSRHRTSTPMKALSRRLAAWQSVRRATEGSFATGVVSSGRTAILPAGRFPIRPPRP